MCVGRGGIVMQMSWNVFSTLMFHFDIYPELFYIFLKWIWALMTAFKLIFMFFLGLGKKKNVQFVFSHIRTLSSASFPTTILYCAVTLSWFPGPSQILLSVALMKLWGNPDPGDETLELWRAVLMCVYSGVVYTWIALMVVYFFQLCSKTLLLWLA